MRQIILALLFLSLPTTGYGEDYENIKVAGALFDYQQFCGENVTLTPEGAAFLKQQQDAIPDDATINDNPMYDAFIKNGYGVDGWAEQQKIAKSLSGEPETELEKVELKSAVEEDKREGRGTKFNEHATRRLIVGIQSFNLAQKTICNSGAEKFPRCIKANQN